MTVCLCHASTDQYISTTYFLSEKSWSSGYAEGSRYLCNRSDMAAPPRAPARGCWAWSRFSLDMPAGQPQPGAAERFLHEREANKSPPLNITATLWRFSPRASAALQETYLRSSRKTAGVSLSASVCRSTGSLCSWPCCGGALCTKWTTAPATTGTPYRKGWRRPLALGLKCVCKCPHCQTLARTALPRTATTPHKQPERNDKKDKKTVTGAAAEKGWTIIIAMLH